MCLCPHHNKFGSVLFVGAAASKLRRRKTSNDTSDDNGGNIDSDKEADESDGKHLQDKPETKNTRGWSELILQ